MANNLLIIDDDKEVVEVISIVLEDLFDIVHRGNNLDQACLFLTENAYALILLDINLGNRNGAEVIKFLNESLNNVNKNVPVVIISGIMTSKFVDRYHYRFAGMVMKPFSHKDLKEMVQEILNPTTLSVPVLKCNLPFPVENLEVEVENVLQVVKNSPKLKQLFNQLKIDRHSDQYLLSHISLLINISTALSIQMKWNTDSSLKKFVYAAYLHNIALADRPDLAKINTLNELENKKDSLTIDEYKLVYEHPNIAANDIELIDEIPSDVTTIIRQHHEFPLETGFPGKCGHQKISALSSLFIFAHDLTEHILANPDWNIEEYLEKSKAKFKAGHFLKIVKSFNLNTDENENENDNDNEYEDE